MDATESSGASPLDEPPVDQEPLEEVLSDEQPSGEREAAGAEEARLSDDEPADARRTEDSSPLKVLNAEIVESRPAKALRAASRGSDATRFLPALRADLAPLMPPLRRAATVVAVAAVADWAVRTGSQRLVRHGISLARSGAPSLLAREPGSLARPLRPGQRRSETVIVERIIIHRS